MVNKYLLKVNVNHPPVPLIKACATVAYMHDINIDILLYHSGWEGVNSNTSFSNRSMMKPVPRQVNFTKMGVKW